MLQGGHTGKAGPTSALCVACRVLTNHTRGEYGRSFVLPFKIPLEDGRDPGRGQKVNLHPQSNWIRGSLLSSPLPQPPLASQTAGSIEEPQAGDRA